MSQPPPSASEQGLVERWAALGGESERRQFVEQHPEILDPRQVERLCDEVGRQKWIDLPTAERLARAAVGLADRLEGDVTLARAERALANTLHKKGDHRGAMRAYESALARFELAGCDLEAAVTRSSSLSNLVYLGEYERADRWVSRARETFAEAGDHLRLARLDLNYANVLYRQDRWREALELYHRAWRSLERLGGPEDLAICLSNLAVCQISLANFTEALDVYRRAREHCQTHGLRLLLHEIDYNIAYLHYLRGEHLRAIRLYQSARVRFEELGDDQHTALCDLDQAEIFLELNLVEEAAQLASAAHRRFEKLGMGYEAAKAQCYQAIASGRRGQAFAALDLLARARRIFEREQNLVWPALIDLYRALIYYGEGRLYEATSLALAARRHFDRHGLATKLAMCEILLARLELQLDRPDGARVTALGAIEKLRPLRIATLLYQAYFVLGQAEEAAGRFHRAGRAYAASRSWLERSWSGLETNELKIAFLEDHLVVYESLVWLGLERPELGWTAPRILGWMERAKSRGLADLIAFRAHALPPRRSPQGDLVEEIRELREELGWYYRQLDQQQLDRPWLAEGPPAEGGRGGPENARPERPSGTARRREERLRRTLEAVRRGDRELGSLQDGAPVEIEEILGALPEDALLVEYYVARNGLYAAVATGERVEIRALTPLSRVREAYRQLQLELGRVRPAVRGVRRGGGEQTARQPLRRLYDELVRPLEPLLDRRHLIVVPHGFLHHLPFPALEDGGQALVDRHVISCAPSASVFHLCSVKPTAPGDRLLVVGAETASSPEVSGLAALPNCELLAAEALAAEGLDAAALGERLDGYRFVHLASRVGYRPDNPMFSSLELGSRRLSLFELYDLRLSAEVVSITGCGSDLAAVPGGDELVGLVRGLLYAGARSVLAGLWDSPGESSSRLLELFYRRLAGGGDAARALRHAMREVRDSFPDPADWAPFALIGGAGYIKTPAAAP